MGIKTRKKIVRNVDGREVIYEKSRWELLRKLRGRAREIAKEIPFRAYLHGSVARGDVTKNSDVDIVILDVIPSYIIESAINYHSRRIVQATPNSVIKAVYEVDEKTNIIFPLTKMRWHELEFYDFGGKVDVSSDERVKGVDKKLLFIDPTPHGHMEWSIIGREDEVARILGIHSEVVRERVRVLTRRDRIGRTGVYLNVIVPENKSVEEILKIIADRDPAVRRRMRE